MGLLSWVRPPAPPGTDPSIAGVQGSPAPRGAWDSPAYSGADPKSPTCGRVHRVTSCESAPETPAGGDVESACGGQPPPYTGGTDIETLFVGQPPPYTG